MAPDILPRMEGAKQAVRTLLNTKQDARDSQALAPWVFYGTLAERVFTDEELRNPDAVIARYGDLLPKDQPLTSLSERQVGLYRQFHSAINKSLDDLALSEMARFAKVSKLAVANRNMNLQQAANFYFDQVAGDLEQVMAEIEEVQERHASELELLESAAGDQASDADARKTYASLLSGLKAQQAAEKESAHSKLADLLKMKDAFLGRAEKVSKLKSNGYAPLMRFGRYTVDAVLLNEEGKPVKDGEGNELRAFFGMFETESEANTVARELRDEYPEYTVTQGVLSELEHKLFQGVTPENAQLFAEAAGFEADEAFQKYLKMATANRSAMKRMIHRKGTAGFSFDATRILASFIASNSRAAASNWHMGDMLKSVSAIPKHKGDVKDEAIKLLDYVRSPAEGGLSPAIRGMLFTWFLGGSVASAMVNMTQTFTTTLPYLSQFGKVGTVADEVQKAMRLAAKRQVGNKSTGDAALDALLRRAEEEGIVSPQEMHMIQGEASRGASVLVQNPAWRALVTRHPSMRYAGRFIDAFKNLWGAGFSISESYNRQVAFIAAYRIAENKGMTADEAYQFAGKAVLDTQFNYSKSGRSNWARNPAGAILLTFKTFLVNYGELIYRLARYGDAEQRKAALLMLGTLFLMAGAQGMPGADDADDIIDSIGQKLGYRGNTKAWKQEVLGDLFGNDEFGKTVSGFIMHGVSYASPIDISGRLSVGNIVPGTSLFKKSDKAKIDDVAEMIGPGAGLATKLFDGIDHITDGKGINLQLVEKSAPKAFADMAKAVMMLQADAYRDMRGRKVVETDNLDAAYKFFGFQPNSVAIVRRAERFVMQDIALHRNIKSDVAELWARGVFERDSGKIERAREIVADWNDKNPGMPMKIKGSQIQRRVTEMNKLSGVRLAKTAPSEIRGNVKSVLTSGELE
jgi:hypothetical protein